MSTTNEIYNRYFPPERADAHLIVPPGDGAEAEEELLDGAGVDYIASAVEGYPAPTLIRDGLEYVGVAGIKRYISEFVRS